MNQRRLAGLSILVAGHMLFTAQVWAASWQSAVSSRVSTEFDSNPTMSPSSPGGVWRALFEPGYALTGREGENELRAGLGLQVERSSNPALSQNRDSPRLNLGGLHQGEVNTFGISYDYREIAIRNAQVDATAQGIYGTSASRTLSGTWSNALTERSTLSVDGSHAAVTYKGGPYLDYSLQTGGLKYGYVFSEGNTSFIAVSEDKYMPSVGGQSARIARALLGLELKGEDIDWTVQAGKFKGSQDNSGLLGSVGAHYTGQRNQLILNAGHLVFPSGLGGFVNADQEKASWLYALSENSNAGIDLEHDKYHYLGNRNISSVAGNAIDYSTTIAGVWMERDLNFFWKMRAYCQHRMNKVVGVDGAFSNVLGISFAYLNPDF